MGADLRYTDERTYAARATRPFLPLTPLHEAQTTPPLSILGLFAGCGGSVDLCDLIIKGACRAGLANDVPIDPSGLTYPDDIVAAIRTGLLDVSMQFENGSGNSCLVNGLAGITFDKQSTHSASYDPETRTIVLNPAKADAITDPYYRYEMMGELYWALGQHVYSQSEKFCPELSQRFAAISWDVDGVTKLDGMNPDLKNGDFLDKANAVENARGDFATSFSFYIQLSGYFLKRAETSDVLGQKYEFMRSLFNDREF